MMPFLLVCATKILCLEVMLNQFFVPLYIILSETK